MSSKYLGFILENEYRIQSTEVYDSLLYLSQNIRLNNAVIIHPVLRYGSPVCWTLTETKYALSTSPLEAADTILYPDHIDHYIMVISAMKRGKTFPYSQ